MSGEINRREFLQITAGGVTYFAGSSLFAADAGSGGSKLISPGCRRSKVKVARLYVGTKGGLWPTPKLNFRDEMESTSRSLPGWAASWPMWILPSMSW